MTWTKGIPDWWLSFLRFDLFDSGFGHYDDHRMAVVLRATTSEGFVYLARWLEWTRDIPYNSPDRGPADITDWEQWYFVTRDLSEAGKLLGELPDELRERLPKSQRQAKAV